MVRGHWLPLAASQPELGGKTTALGQTLLEGPRPARPSARGPTRYRQDYDLTGSGRADLDAPT